MTEKASPGDRETWWQKQLDEANESSRNNSRCLEQSIQREEATSRELKKVSESYWNMSRTLKLTQEERNAAEARVRELTAENERLLKETAEWKYWRSTAVKACDRAESRLAAATALLKRVVRRGPTRGDGLLNGDILRFLASQPAACNDCGAVHAPETSSPGTVNQPAAPCTHVEGCTPECVRKQELALTAAPTRTETMVETDEEREEMARGFGFGDYATMVRLLAKRGFRAITEAEQSVLIAMQGAAEASLRKHADDWFGWFGNVSRAELSRRGLK